MNAATIPWKWFSTGTAAWTRMERTVFVIAAVTTCVLAYAYCFHMYRPIPYDEIGLHNPIYMYSVTGKITYPMHGQPDFMTVHPPTHYILAALLVKAGLPLFKASAAPVFALTILIPLLLYTGGFSFGSAVALLLAVFLAAFIWGDFYTIRPDLMVTYLWFAGLLALQGARNRHWSHWRLFLGTALTASAACIHYWGIAALAGALVYCFALLWERGWKPSTTARPLAAMAAGGLVVGLPFMVLFVIPRFPDILQMVHDVQGRGGGPGGPYQAFQRHIESYAALSHRVQLDTWVRWLTSLLTAPVLDLRIPAVLIGVPLVALWRDVRILAVAGAPLPLFVLFYSQAKQIGYTGYLMPEMVIYFAGILLLLINIPARLFSGPARPIARVAAAIPVLVLTVVQVPSSMGDRFDWTAGLDLLEVSRGAAMTIVGRHAVVGMPSAATWYTGGGRYVWTAFNDLVTANRNKLDISAYLQSIDALVIDLNWWNAVPNFAPVSSWYLERVLHLKGFVLPNTQATILNFELFVATQQGPIIGYFIDKERVTKFNQAGNGEATFAVLSCPHSVDLSSLSAPFYKMSFAYMSEPQAKAPQIVLLGIVGEANLPKRVAAQWDCAVRDSIHGTLLDVPRDELRKAGSVDYRSPISFYQSRDEALRAAGRSVLASASQRQVLSGPTATLPLQSLQPQNGGSLSAHDGSVLLTTSAQQWAYAAIAPLSLPAGSAGPGVVRVRLQVEQGRLGIGVLARGNASQMLAEQAADVTSTPAEVDIDLADVANAGSIVLRSWSPNEVSVRARIFSIETLLRAASQP